MEFYLTVVKPRISERSRTWEVGLVAAAFMCLLYFYGGGSGGSKSPSLSQLIGSQTINYLLLTVILACLICAFILFVNNSQYEVIDSLKINEENIRSTGSKIASSLSDIQCVNIKLYRSNGGEDVYSLQLISEQTADFFVVLTSNKRKEVISFLESQNVTVNYLSKEP